MEDKIVLELTKSEVLMLQELTEDMEYGYVWIRQIADSLREKALAAYQKPTISREDYRKQMEATEQLWKGEPAEWFMIHAKKREIRFFNKLEGEDEATQEAHKGTEDTD